LDLGEDLVGALVALEREPARALPCAVPLLLRLLHAALLARRRAAAREPVRGVRALRRDPHSGELPRNSPRAEVHPSRRVHPARAELPRLDPRDLLRGADCDARARVHALPCRARRQAPRPPAPRAASGVRVSTAEKYVTAAYCVVFALVLLYVVIIALKLQRLEREVDELVARPEAAEEDEREPVHIG